MSESARQSLLLAWRQLRNLSRQPWYIAITLVQPVAVLLLAASLFGRIATLPGFGWESYISFVAPGVVIMGAIFLGGWSGIAVLGDIDRGVMDRLLVTPARRPALVAGRLIHLSVQVVIQSTILVVLAGIRGADFENGIVGMLTLVATAVLIALPVGSLSIAIALATRRHETLIAGVSMVLLPLIFVSTLFMPEALVPHWIAVVSAYNPVEWAGEAARATVSPGLDWGAIMLRFAGLIALTAAGVALAVRSFRSYLRAV